VAPATGETVWYLSNGINKPFFAELLAAFARQTGAGHKRIILLVLDNAGWHGPARLAVPDGVFLVYLPPYSPELQPAEHLWPLLDEPLANQYFETLQDLDAVVAQRCNTLDPQVIQSAANFHWWPTSTPAS
jgi:transposase